MLSFLNLLPNKEKRLGLILFLSLIIFSLLFGVWWYYQNSEDMPARGGSYSEGMLGQPALINPLISQSDTDRSLVPLLFSSLSNLADKITEEKESEGKIFTLRLKENLRWHDGQAITADDIIFTIEKMREYPKSPMSSTFLGVNAKRESEVQIRFELPSPYPEFPALLELFYPLPSHKLAQMPVENWRLSRDIISPIGSGPYRVEKVSVKDSGFIDSISLRSFDGNWNEPYITRLQIEFFSTPQELTDAFSRGQIDGYSVASQDFIEVYRPHKKISWQAPVYYGIFLNGAKNPALDRKEVRQAISLSLDRKAISKLAIKDESGAIQNPLYDIPTEKDIASAQVLLEKNGWIKNEEGFYELALGKDQKIPLSLVISHPEEKFIKEAAEAVAEEWNDVGIKVTLHQQDTEELIKGEVRNRTFEAVLLGNAPTLGDLYPFWHSKERFYPGNNITMADSIDLDGALVNLRESAGSDRREESREKIRKFMAEENPAIFLFSPKIFHIHSANLRGLESGTRLVDSSFRFGGAKKWYVNTTRVLGK